jgi:hypothetical protein
MHWGIACTRTLSRILYESRMAIPQIAPSCFYFELYHVGEANAFPNKQQQHTKMMTM